MAKLHRGIRSVVGILKAVPGKTPMAGMPMKMQAGKMRTKMRGGKK